MINLYLQYLNDINNELIRRGIRLPINLSCDKDHIISQISILEKYLYFNKVLGVCDSSHKIPISICGSDVSYMDWLKAQIKSEYEEVWKTEISRLKSQPEDAGKINLRVRPLDLESLSSSVYSDNPDFTVLENVEDSNTETFDDSNSYEEEDIDNDYVDEFEESSGVSGDDEDGHNSYVSFEGSNNSGYAELSEGYLYEEDDDEEYDDEDEFYEEDPYEEDPYEEDDEFYPEEDSDDEDFEEEDYSEDDFGAYDDEDDFKEEDDYDEEDPYIEDDDSDFGDSYDEEDPYTEDDSDDLDFGDSYDEEDFYEEEDDDSDFGDSYEDDEYGDYDEEDPYTEDDEDEYSEYDSDEYDNLDTSLNNQDTGISTPSNGNTKSTTKPERGSEDILADFLVKGVNTVFRRGMSIYQDRKYAESTDNKG